VFLGYKTNIGVSKQFFKRRSGEMSRIILVTGGVRSGKSRFSASVFEGLSDVTFIATMQPCDEETRARVASHRECRPANWETVEESLYPENAVGECKNYILDCVTLLVSNIMMETVPDLENIGPKVQNLICARAGGELSRLIEKVRGMDGTLVMVTNETGFSVVPENEVARAFRDILSAVNRDVASLCDEVYLSVCGYQLRLH
jgi:adenosylcobinamide kinase/adenosylcobinamide-phosphate guanylyltransferase